MNPETTPSPAPPASRASLIRNWTTLTGLVIAGGALFSFLLLSLLDAMSHGANPYIGILTYLIAPGFLVLGLGMTILGLLLRRRRILKEGGAVPRMQIDLQRPRDRRIMGIFIGSTVVFLLLSAIGSYQTYHFTESVTFCGKACHEVMSPEMVAYQQGPHARVSCAECHIGAGAGWYVRSKLSGAYQVYATLANKYPRPIPTPIQNLRPAQETCEQCHWPSKFVGNLDQTFNYYLTDPTNSPFAVRLLMKVGGADPTHGPVGGIHWHMNVGQKVEYIAAKKGTNGLWIADLTRQSIPWVRTMDKQGAVREFRAAKFTNDPSGFEIRKMDCMDCHNRPAHGFKAPNDSLNLALSLGQIDATLPSIKSNGLWVLTQTYADEPEALEKIATALTTRYPNEPRIRPAIDTIQSIYRRSFFPKMKVNWRGYTDNIGHMYWPGCFRCHDGLHKTADGKESIKASDCNACHVILTQGSGKALETLAAKGQDFQHPGGDLDPNPTCHECHNGGL